MSVYLRTSIYFRPFFGSTLAALLLSLASIAFGLLQPWPVKYLIDGILIPETPSTAAVHLGLRDIGVGIETSSLVISLCLAMVVVKLISGILNLFKSYLFTRAGLCALLNFRTDIYACLQSLPLQYHDSRRIADSSFRVAYDSQSIQTIYASGFAGVFTSVVTLAGAVIVMARMDWFLTLVSIGILPAVILAIRVYATRIRLQSTVIHENESSVLAAAQEGLASIRMIHAFGRENYEVAQFRAQAEQSLRSNLRFTNTSVISGLVAATLMSIGTAVMYFVGSNAVLRGVLTVGDLVVFASYLAMLYGPLESLIYTAWAMQGAAAGAQRCFEVLDREKEMCDAPGAILLPPDIDGICFDQVGFAYNTNRPILQDINLFIPAGQSVAFVGCTGAGKSTLLSLVPRFYEATHGRVFVGGHDVRNLTKKSLRSQIGVVLQDTLLFSTTVRENIAYGRPDATEDEIIEAAMSAQAHDFIMKMDGGYRSQVGEHGGRLSVGQRQRIGIARAFLKNAPILLLDEPTSALDASTERSIVDTISELMRNRTTLLITHRIGTAHGFDRIVVLDNGIVVEDGKGEELLARNAFYARLHNSGHYKRNELKPFENLH